MLFLNYALGVVFIFKLLQTLKLLILTPDFDILSNFFDNFYVWVPNKNSFGFSNLGFMQM